jgi:hypothetical protein
VPAAPSSPIPAALTHLTHTDPRELPDPDVLHLLAGARSIAAIADWVADASQPVRAALGVRRDAPDHFAVPAEATIRRTLARLNADALAAAVGAWLADRDRECPRPAADRAVCDWHADLPLGGCRSSGGLHRRSG